MDFKDIFCLDSDELVPNITNTKSKSNKPWIEKYRPKTLDDIIDQDDIVKMLKNTVETGNLPHLLFHGPAGTGKTSTILAVARELFGPKVYRKRIIELNASDERGINIVRKKIVKFAKMKPCSSDKDYKKVSYKIIILDEADAMTTEAQSALRKVMEDYSEITRFCFICNYINKIIDPINSRCVKYRFKSMRKKDMFGKLKDISVAENINIDNNAIKEIIHMGRGDMRKSIMYLQNSKYIESDKISIDNIRDITGYIPENITKNINKICMYATELNIKNVHNLTNIIYKRGYPIENILYQLNDIVLMSHISDISKSMIFIKMADTDRKLVDGADEYLQLLDILSYIHNISINNKN